MVDDMGALFEVIGKSVGMSVQGDTSDESLDTVVEWFRQQADTERLFADGFRQAIDEVLDGQRTGRFDLDQLDKNEKTYLGTKVEIVIRAAFELPRGEFMDYKIAGHDVDAKWSIRRHGWNIPREAIGHICLLMYANDREEVFEVGLIRIRPEYLNDGQNQDQKRTLNAYGRSQITWLFRDAALPRNLLLWLDPQVREQILAHRSGQKRVIELLRQVRGVLINRTVIETVAPQDDPMKRGRDARPVLRQEGIAVLGHQNDSPRIARDLAFPVPPKGNFISVRLERVADDTVGRATTSIGAYLYAVSDSDESTDPLPDIRY